MSDLILLTDPEASDPARSGHKAATLARLLETGFPIPEGIVLPVDCEDAARQVIERLGNGPLAVRSSGIAEDAADASWAGQYESVLGVRGAAALARAIEQVRASGASERARSYGAAEARIPVLVQRQIAPTVAGVAFTADPISGARDVTVVTGNAGTGTAVVDGASDADTWRIKDGVASRSGGRRAALDEGVATEVADLAARVAVSVGAGPVDIEWARADGVLWLLQARPMTALPESVVWPAPRNGAFARNFRLGEWLGDPVTPLFESWLLTTLEDRLHQIHAALIGVQAPRPLHIVANGWYYYSLAFMPASAGAAARSLPHILRRLARDPRRVAPMLPPIAHLGVELWEREWRNDLLPRYLAACAAAERRVDLATLPELVSLIDELATLAGEYFASITVVAGFAWKSEIPLAQLYQKTLARRIGGSHLDLLQGLHHPGHQAHDLASLDWWHPTLGERGPIEADPGADARHSRLAAARAGAEERARAALRDRPRELARFEQRLDRAQRAIAVREEQLADFSRPWPVLRRAVFRLGAALERAEVIDAPELVFFLTAAELRQAIADPPALRPPAAQRRATWQRQRRLVPPLVLGTLPPMLAQLLTSADRALRRADGGPGGALVQGTAASAGTATGTVRIVRSQDDFGSLGQGEVLVCPATTPAWTTLFSRAVAVVTDTGNPASHASIVAREYGIPAIVGTGNATQILRDGQQVRVDGAAGTVSAL
ncbi:MAG: PEP/pyruvate-binding domain-containing protein [Candidatus Limnocylindrales bacterium]